MTTVFDYKWTAALIGGAGVASIGLIYLGYKKYKGEPMRPNPSVLKSYESSDPLTSYVFSHNVDDKALGELRSMSIRHKRGKMTTSIEVGKLLTICCRALNARKVLDVGFFTGCSAFSLALGLPEDGKVIACDVSEEYASLGKPFLEKGGVSGKIDLRLQPATKTLQELLDNGEADSFDLVFIDADKVNYGIYYELGMKLLRKGGLVLVDNALWGGRVLDPTDKTDDTAAIRTLNQTMKDDPRAEFLLLNVCDGVGIGQKL